MSKGRLKAEMLLEGKTLEKTKEGGGSMVPLIHSNQPVTLEPLRDRTLKVGDIVFCKVKGNYYTHKITAIRGEQYQIGNNKGRINGWVTKQKIYGIVTKIWVKQ